QKARIAEALVAPLGDCSHTAATRRGRHRRAHLCNLRIDANLNDAFGNETVRRNAQVRGRRHVLEGAACHVELRSVAWAIKAAGPVGTELRVLRLETTERSTSEVSTNAHEHEVFGLERTRVVLRVLGLLGFLRCRIAQLPHDLRISERLEHFRRTPDDEDRLAAPIHLDDATDLELADVLFYGRAERLRAGARFPRCEEWDRGSGQPRSPRYRGGD